MIPKNINLHSARCRLRFISREDIPRIFSASRYEGFTDGMLWEPPATEDELLQPYLVTVKAWEDDRAYCFTIETQDKSTFIGRISIRREPEEDHWNLGFWTHPVQQNKGYMSEAVATILRFGFEELRATKILACHATWNTASEKVLCNNGMTFLKHIPQGYQKKGQWVPENLLAITAPAWRASQRNLP